MKAGTIGVAANDTARFTAFTFSLAAIQSPPGSKIAWAIGSDIVNSRNLIVEKRFEGDWVWFMDDDHVFEPKILMKLLAHNLPVVAPLCLMRQEPFYAVAQSEEGKALALDGSTPHKGIQRVWATGTAGMLIRRDVFSKLSRPFFRKQEGVSEDYLFCQSLREANIPIHVDLGARLGHCTTTVVWPDETEDGDWCVEFQISDSYFVDVGISTE